MVTTFPIFVLERDSGDVGKFDTVEEAQKHLEKIDVENGEYEAWDGTGAPLALTVEETLWLALHATGEPPDGELRAALLRIADRSGVDLDESARSTLGPSELFERIAAKARPSAGNIGFLGR